MLAKSLASRHNAQVISFKSQYPSWLYPGKSNLDPSQATLQINAKFLIHPLNPWTWINTSNHIQLLNVDFTILQWWTTFWSLAFISLGLLLKRHGVPILYIIHNVLPHEPRFFDPWLSYYALKQGDAFICQTKKEAIILHDFLPEAKIAIAPHPIYNMFNQKGISKERARQILNLPIDQPVALFFGIVRGYKGLSFLLEAIAHLKQQGKLVKLIVAGEFWERISDYMKRINQLQITELVHIENRYIPNEEVSVYFSAADVFVAPYIGGTQSGAVKIALAYGLPCVLTTPIAGQEFNQIRTLPVKVVPPGDSSALAQAILECLSSPSSKDLKNPLLDNAGWDELVNVIEKAYFQYLRKNI